MGYAAKLMKSRPILGRVPAPSIVQNGDAIATRGDGHLFIYLPDGGEVSVDLSKVSGGDVKAWWYALDTGHATEIGTYENSARTFDAGNEDRVLVIDDSTKGYAAPGAQDLTQ